METLEEIKPRLTLRLLGNFACLFSSDSWFFFFQNQLFWKRFSGIPSECQTVWIQIRPDILSGLIWFQTICPKVISRSDGASRQRVSFACFFSSDSWFFFKMNFLKKIFEYTFRVSNSLDTDQAQTFCRAWPGSKLVAQKLSADLITLEGKELTWSLIVAEDFFKLNLKFHVADDSNQMSCLFLPQKAAGSSLTGITVLRPWAPPWTRHIYPCLVLVQPRKTCPHITEKLLTGM